MNSSASYSSMMRSGADLTFLKCRFWIWTWPEPLVSLRMQLRDQLVERGCDAAPVIEPFPRKPQRDLGGAERALVDACAGQNPNRPRAAHEELLGLLCEV